MSNSLRPHGLKHTRPPLSITNTRSLLNSCPSNWWCRPTFSSSFDPFSSWLQSCPASGSFPMSHFFPSGGQSIGVSAEASVQFSSVAQSCPTLCDPMNRSIQTSLHLSHSQQMIPRLDKKYHTEKIQIVTSFKDSLEELTRFTHRCIVAMVYWSGRLQSTVNIGNKHMGWSAEKTRHKLPGVLARGVTQMCLISPAMSCEGTCETWSTWMLIRDAVPKVFVGIGHISSICLAHNKISEF